MLYMHRFSEIIEESSVMASFFHLTFSHCHSVLNPKADLQKITCLSLHSILDSKTEKSCVQNNPMYMYVEYLRLNSTVQHC